MDYAKMHKSGLLEYPGRSLKEYGSSAENQSDLDDMSSGVRILGRFYVSKYAIVIFSDVRLTFHYELLNAKLPTVAIYYHNESYFWLLKRPSRSKMFGSFKAGMSLRR